MLNKFFSNKIKSSLIISLIIYICLNILMYFYWEKDHNDLETFDETKSVIVKSDGNSDMQRQVYGLRIPIALIPMSLFLGFSQFLSFKYMTKRFYKISDSQTETKKL